MWTLQFMIADHEAARHDVPVGAEFVIGRDPTADIVINEKSVSRKHCRVVGTSGGVEVVDLKSANGIWVDGHQVESTRLGNGSEMLIGSARVRVARKDGPTGMVPLVDLADLGPPGEVTVPPASNAGDSSAWLNAGNVAYKTLEKERLALLLEAGKSLSGALEVDEVLERILDHLFQILPVKRAVIALRGADGKLTARIVRPDAQLSELSSICSQHIIQHVIDTQKAQIIEDASLDQQLNSAYSILAMNIKAAICAPLTAQSRVLGAVYADYPGRPALYTPNDLEFFSAFASLAAVSLENARLQTEARDRASIQRDLEIAADIQMGLLPDKSVEFPGMQIDWAYRPSRHVGGDFYDCVAVDGGRIALVMGDVSGKSVGAALFMARIMSVIRAVLEADPSPASVLTRCNRLLGSRNDSVMFATACVILLDTVNHTVQWSSAGHNPALVYDPATDRFSELGSSGIPVGIEQDREYTQESMELPAGALVVLYTDGMVEARNKAGVFFGLDAVKTLVRRHAAGKPQDITQALIAAVDNHWRDSNYIRDDFAILISKLAP